MNRRVFVVALTLLLLAPASRASAQLLAAKDGPIVYGHHHLAVTSVADHKKFWVDTLGGAAVTIGTNNQEIIKFPNALLFMRAMAPTGGSKGTTVNHIGFSVTNLRAVVDKAKANGYKMVTAQEAPAAVKVQNDIGAVSGGDVSGIAYVMGPDDIKVELVEIAKQTMPIMSHHVHFFSQKPEEVQAWYVKVFGSKPRAAATNGIIGSDLPGIGLSVSSSPEPVVGTRGRVIDHIGFELKGLEEFCKKLEAQGIKLDRPYTPVPALGIAIAFITDPWGTYIELTEGLDKVS
ncbi:MAG TPA: VOC family protein [Vicinamibacterales bacterium]|nr:VOC family protein [Vicinamibacterales bacterium]